MSRRGSVNPKFLIIAAAGVLVIAVMTIVFYPSSDVQNSENQSSLLNEDGSLSIKSAQVENSENTVSQADSEARIQGVKAEQQFAGQGGTYLGKTTGNNTNVDDAQIPSAVRGKTQAEISQDLKNGKNAEVAVWGKSDSADGIGANKKGLKIDSVQGLKLKEKPKKIGQCFLAKFKITKGNVNRKLKLDTDSLNKRSVCVRVDGAPVKYKVTKGGDILIGSIGNSKDLTVRYCVGGWSCSESCKVADDDFMAAIGGLGGSLKGSDSADTGFNEKGRLGSDEKKLDKEISGLRKQIAALRKKEGKKTVSIKASKESLTCESRLVRKKSLTAKR